MFGLSTKLITKDKLTTAIGFEIFFNVYVKTIGRDIETFASLTLFYFLIGGAVVLQMDGRPPRTAAYHGCSTSKR